MNDRVDHLPSFELISAFDVRAQTAMRRYFEELNERFVDGFEFGDALGSEAEVFEPPTGAFIIAVDASSEPDAVAGCGGVQSLGTAADGSSIAEIKRMWIAPSWRGKGLGGALLRELESAAERLGHRRIRLDTNGVLHDAIAMYRRRGYVDIERYNDNLYAELWFEKRL